MTPRRRVSDLTAIGAMVGSDLRQRLRDKSVVIFGLVVPFALILVMNATFGGLNPESLDPVSVTLVSARDDPSAEGLAKAIEMLRAPRVKLTRLTPADDNARESRLEQSVKSGRTDAAIVLPTDFTSSLMGGGRPAVTLHRRSGIGAVIISYVVDGFVNRATAAAQAAAVAGSRGLDPATIAKVAQDTASPAHDLALEIRDAPPGQLSTSGTLVAGQAAFFMYFTIGFGVIAYVGERELGTLPRLRSSPIARRTIVTAKVIVSFILGLVATSVLLAAGALLFDLHYDNLVTVGAVVVAGVGAVSALGLVMIRLASTADQAQMATSVIGVVFGLLGGSFFQITGSGLLARISDLTPTAAFIHGIGIGADGGTIADAASPLLILVGFGAVAAVVASLLPDRSTPR